MLPQHAPARIAAVNGLQEPAMQREGASSARTTLHHREVIGANVVHYLPLRSPPSRSLGENGPPRRTFSNLMAAALSWMLNEIVEGLAAYADTIHPIIPPISTGTLARQEAADEEFAEEHRANSQSREAESRRQAYVRMMMVRSNAWIPPSSGRGSR
jgi:hypothetical protein